VRLLTLNLGSSSLKAALYEMGPAEQVAAVAHAERIRRAGSRLRLADADGAALLDQPGDLPDFDAAVRALFAALAQQGLDAGLAAVGHRVVHGGSQYREPRLVDDALLDDLERLVPLDPEHLPQAIGAIRAIRDAHPVLPQVACFDTAFHRDMPRVAQIYALPRALEAVGVVRYGFHGLSYEYVVQALRAEDPAAAEPPPAGW
jgi:acetate kinase